MMEKILFSKLLAPCLLVQLVEAFKPPRFANLRPRADYHSSTVPLLRFASAPYFGFVITLFFGAPFLAAAAPAPAAALSRAAQ